MRKASDVLLNETLSIGNAFTSAVEINYQLGFSITVRVSGAGSGTWAVQASNGDDIWVDIKDSEETFTTAEDFIQNVRLQFYSHFRVRFTITSGGPGIYCRFTSKGG